MTRVLVVVLMSIFAGAIAGAPLTVEDYATMATPQDPQLSPDGKRVAYVLSRADLEKSAYDTDVWLVDADGTRNRQLTRGEKSDSSPRWSPDGKTIAFLSDRSGATAIYLLPLDGGEAVNLTGESTPVRAFEWSPDGRSMAFLRTDDQDPEQARRAKEKDDAWVVDASPRFVHLHVIDVESQKVRRLTAGTFSIWDFDWSPDGKTIAFTRGPGIGLDDMYRTDIFAVPAAGGDMFPLIARPGIDRRPVFSPDGKALAFVSGGGVHDWLREHKLHALDLGSGAIRNIGNSYDRTPEVVSWSDDSRTIWLGGPFNSTSQLFRINADGSEFTNVSNVDGAVDDVQIRNGRIVFMQQTLTTPPELYVSELSRFAPRRLTDINVAYRDRTIGGTRRISWKNPKDGMEIDGFLTLPVGYKAGQRVPLLTFVHGGPASRFDQSYLGYLGYIYVPQVFAAKGYAVFRPNPRGTGGYGENFRKANRNDWGGMDWIDINAGIDQILAQGLADPERLGIMGWSYGGFMTSWAIGHSDRFKAISIGAPVVDLLSFHGTSDIRDFIPHYFGGASLSLELLRARSPLWHLKATKAPVLIQHGEADERVPLSQGTMLYRVLQELGVDVTMVVYPRTPHTPREPKLRIDVAQRNVDFFTKHIPVR